MAFVARIPCLPRAHGLEHRLALLYSRQQGHHMFLPVYQHRAAGFCRASAIYVLPTAHRVLKTRWTFNADFLRALQNSQSNSVEIGQIPGCLHIRADADELGNGGCPGGSLASSLCLRPEIRPILTVFNSGSRSASEIWDV